jgi:hypothetical protein
VALIVEKAASFKKAGYMTYETAAKILGWKLKSFKRYLKRIGEGERAVKARGRKPIIVRVEDIESLKRELAKIPHSAKRSHGTEELERKYQGAIPREVFRRLLKQARKECRKQIADSWKHVEWNCPGLAWSMDVTEYVFNGMRFFILQIMDMTTKYRFEPVIGREMFCGDEVAGHLAWLHSRYGAPLFQKRDNGGNLNAGAVNDVLSEACIIPLNSPSYCPRYNGTMENGQNELKGELDRILASERMSTEEGFIGVAHRATNSLNHKRRAVLGWETSCFNYSRNTPRSYSKQQRSEVNQWIKGLALDIYGTSTYNERELWFDKSWRAAVEAWLIRHQFITVVSPQEVLPISA